MVKTMFRNKFWLVIGICLMVMLSSSDAFAWHRGGPREDVVVGPHRYHYRDGRFYRPGWFGFDFVVVAPPIGAVIKVLPPRRNIIIVRGVRYYYYDNIYYTDCPGGYIVVTPPIVVTPIGTVVKVLPPRHDTIIVKDVRYYYYDNIYYTDCPDGYIVATPPIGAIIKVLSPGYDTIIVKDVKYYYYNDVYYTDCPGGYIVVPAPAITPDVVSTPAEQPQAPSGETVIINIPNAGGGYTPVTLVKKEDGYIGPQGEYYQGHPTVDQLKVLYGN